MITIIFWLSVQKQFALHWKTAGGTGTCPNPSICIIWQKDMLAGVKKCH